MNAWKRSAQIRCFSRKNRDELASLFLRSDLPFMRKRPDQVDDELSSEKTRGVGDVEARRDFYDIDADDFAFGSDASEEIRGFIIG